MKHNGLLGFIVSVFFFVLAGQGASAETITFIHGVEYKPYYYSRTTAAGETESAGFLVELLKGAAEIAEVDVAFEVVDGWTRSLNLVRQNRADAMFPLFKTEEREEFMIFPEEAALADEINVVVSLKKSNFTFNGDFNLNKRNVFGVIQNYSYGSEFDNAQLRKVTAPSESDLLRLLQTGQRFDMIVGNVHVLKYLAQEEGIYSQLKFHDYELSQDPLYIGFAKNRVSRETIDRFSAAIAAFKQTPEYAELLRDFNEGKL